MQLTDVFGLVLVDHQQLANRVFALELTESQIYTTHGINKSILFKTSFSGVLLF
jgi:hypothetical protein